MHSTYHQLTLTALSVQTELRQRHSQVQISERLLFKSLWLLSQSAKEFISRPANKTPRHKCTNESDISDTVAVHSGTNQIRICKGYCKKTNYAMKKKNALQVNFASNTTTRTQYTKAHSSCINGCTIDATMPYSNLAVQQKACTGKTTSTTNIHFDLNC